MAQAKRGLDEPATDRFNAPTPDPTENVKALTAAGLLSESLLRQAEGAHIRELLALDRAHNKELRVAEAERINAIRAVDVGNVTRAAEVSSASAAALAASVIQSAEALRVSNEQSRVQTAAALNTAMTPVLAQLESLRQTQFQQQGEKTAQSEGTNDDRFAKVYAQSQEQFVALLRQAQNAQAAQAEQAQAAQATQAAQFVAALGQSRAAVKSSRTGWIVGALVGGGAALVSIASLVVFVLTH